jgi:tetratricopeptide (TPR) repeat protein
MIVVDTGSTDATPDICRELGAQVYHFPWPDSFSIARNESLKYARGQWIFWMDSDDVIDAENGRKLRELVAELVRVPAANLPLPLGEGRGDGGLSNPEDGLPSPSQEARDGLGRPPHSNILGYVVQVHCPCTGKDGFRELTVVDHVKLFRNRPDLRFEGRIHEQIIPAIRRAGGEIGWTDLFVVHAGAADEPEEKQRKLKRDLRLLQLELADRPNQSFAHFNLGMTYEVAGRYDEAIAALTRSLKLADPGESQVRKAYSLLVGCLARVGQHQEAWRKCQEALASFPRDAELLFRHGQLCHHFGRLVEAEQAYRAVLANDEPRHFISIDSGIRGFKTHHNLALVYAEMRDLARSEEQWRQATARAPDHVDGWRGLGEILMREGKYDQLERLASELIARPALRGLALAWQAQPLRARRQFTEAGNLLQQAFDELPDDPDVVQAGCQLLFEAGDLTQCEQAIRHFLRLVPDNPTAHHNLGTLYLRMGRHAEALAPLRKSLELAPANAAAHFHLGHALLGAGRQDQAVRAFAEALRLEPDNPHARDGLAQARAAVARGAPLAPIALEMGRGVAATPVAQTQNT